MLEPRSAEIIAFPARGPATKRPPPHGPERLGKALAAVDDALAAQRRAVVEWRAALADLRGAARSLGKSVQAYRDGLDALGGRVAVLHSEAAELACRAEAACGHRADRAVPRRTPGGIPWIGKERNAGL